MLPLTPSKNWYGIVDDFVNVTPSTRKEPFTEPPVTASALIVIQTFVVDAGIVPDNVMVFQPLLGEVYAGEEVTELK